MGRALLGVGQVKKNRFKEPSTWAGMAAIFASLAPAFPPATVVLGALAGVCGGVAVILREGEPEGQ